MKQRILATMPVLGLCLSSMAANLVWTPGATGNWDLTTENWSLEGTATPALFKNGDAVSFENNGYAQQTVTLSGLLTPATVVVDAAFDYMFDGTGGKLTNVNSLTKRNGGKLIVDSDDVITNLVTIEQGTLQLGNASSRGTLGTGYPGSTASIINNGVLSFNRSALSFSNSISGSGTLELAATATGTWSLYGANSMNNYSIFHKANRILFFGTPSSLGAPASVTVESADGNNARIQMNGGLTFPEGCTITATLAQNAGSDTRFQLMGVAGINTVRGPIRLAGWSEGTGLTRSIFGLYAQNAGNELNVYGSVSETDPTYDPFVGVCWLRGAGTGRMYGVINLPSAQLVKTDPSTWTLYASGNQAFETLVAVGRLTMGISNALPVAPMTVVSELDLAGFGQKSGPLWGNGSIINSSTTADALLTLTNGGAYTGSILDGGTAKIGIKLLNPGAPSAQQLTGNCAYRGPTIIDTGTAIAIGNSGLPNSTPIEMANGSSIDASTIKDDDTFTLGAAQTLQADGTANIVGSFINQGTLALTANKSGGVVTSDKIAVSGQITYGGILALELTGESLAVGDEMQLFQAGSYVPSSFASIVPAIPGAGLIWNTSQLSSGKLAVVALPTIGSVTLSSSGTELTFGGTGGTLGGTYSIVSSTSLSNPVSTWPAVQTGLPFDGAGNFSATITINPSELKRFYSIRMP